MKLLSVLIAPLFVSTSMLLAAGAPASSADSLKETIVLDDFELDTPGDLPKKWRFLSSKERRFRPLKPFMSPQERFFVVEENGNKFLRAYTKGEAQRISLPDRSVDWNLNVHRILRWEWRARHLPEGAREDKRNDSGGAIYVSFSKTDWLGRPLSIKYVYSTSLPVGTVVSTGNVKIIVASSGADGTGRWVRVMRDVVEDYRKLFGGDPPAHPYTVTLWSDSDNTESVGEVDFDNIVLMKRP